MTSFARLLFGVPVGNSKLECNMWDNYLFDSSLLFLESTSSHFLNKNICERSFWPALPFLTNWPCILPAVSLEAEPSGFRKYKYALELLEETQTW